MKQLNFLLIFSFGLAMVMFTLENTAATTVTFLPGLTATLPLAALLLVAASAALHRQCSRWIDQLQQGSGQPPRNRPA